MTPLSSLSIGRGRFTIGARPCVRTVYVGGNYNDDTNAGVSYVNANNSLDNSNNNIGSRLSFNHIMVNPTLALAKITKTIRPVGTADGKIGRKNEGLWVVP